MAATKLNLDRQAVGQTFALGTTSASGEALLTLYKGTAAATTTVLDVKGSATIGGDLTLTGNLNITGSLNEASVTNLAVTDLTIRTNKGGTSAGAAGAGLQVEGDSAALIGAITYASASATKFQIGNGSAQVDIADTSTAQTFTNKSISGGQITSAVANATAATTATKSTNLIGGNSTTQLGSIGYQSNTDTTTLLAPNTTTTKKFMTQTGDGTNGAIPAWGTIAAADVPTLNQTTTGSAAKWTTARNLAGNSVDGSANVAFSNSFIVKGTSDTGLSGAQFLGALATGIVKNTTTTGVLSIATGADLPAMSATVGGAVPTPPNNTTTFLRGDGTFASPGTGFTFNRTTITGTINSVNTAFTLGVTPNPVGSELIVQNGVILYPGSGNDYTITGTGITFATAPATGDILQAFASS